MPLSIIFNTESNVLNNPGLAADVVPPDVQESVPDTEETSSPAVQESAPGTEETSSPAVQESAPDTEETSSPAAQESAPDTEETSSPDVQVIEELLNEYEWRLMQSETVDSSVDNASIYRIAENSDNISQLLVCTNLFLSLILGGLLCIVFSRYLRS